MHKHFPESIQHGDIKEQDFTGYRGTIDVLTGGFPCPEFSFAGTGRMGMELWKEMFRTCREIDPAFIVAENVPGFAYRREGLALDEVCADLESEKYEIIPLIIPAASSGAWHKRDRVWIVAIKANTFNPNTNSLGSYRTEINQQGGFKFRNKQIRLPGSLVSQSIREGSDTRVFRGLNGIPDRVDRLKSLGNSIVPQVALQLFKAIQEYDHNHRPPTPS